MARPLRVEYPGAYYHVVNRGNNQENIYENDRDREKRKGSHLNGLLPEYCSKGGSDRKSKQHYKIHLVNQNI